MTQLLLIKAETYREGLNNIGDIVGSFDDDWKFTEKEIALFSIVKVVETKTVIDIKIPANKSITKATTTEWTEAEPERKNLWQDTDGKFKEIVKDPKYKLSCIKGDIKENYSKYPENLTEIVVPSLTELVK